MCLRCVLGRLIWKQHVRGTEGNKNEDSELLQSKLWVGWEVIKQTNKKRDNGLRAHLFICQIFRVLECAGCKLDTEETVVLSKIVK